MKTKCVKSHNQIPENQYEEKEKVKSARGKNCIEYIGQS